MRFDDVVAFAGTMPLLTAATGALAGARLVTAAVAVPGVAPLSGTFRLTYAGATTADLVYSATAQQVEDALNDLDTIGAGGVTVTDAEVLAAIAWAFTHLKLVVEPGGAVCLAALLSGRFEARGRVVGAVLSGGNVDPAVFTRALAA